MSKKSKFRTSELYKFRPVLHSIQPHRPHRSHPVPGDGAAITPGPKYSWKLDSVFRRAPRCGFSQAGRFGYHYGSRPTGTGGNRSQSRSSKNRKKKGGKNGMRTRRISTSGSLRRHSTCPIAYSRITTRAFERTPMNTCPFSRSKRLVSGRLVIHQSGEIPAPRKSRKKKSRFSLTPGPGAYRVSSFVEDYGKIHPGFSRGLRKPLAIATVVPGPGQYHPKLSVLPAAPRAVFTSGIRDIGMPHDRTPGPKYAPVVRRPRRAVVFGKRKRFPRPITPTPSPFHYSPNPNAVLFANPSPTLNLYG